MSLPRILIHAVYYGPLPGYFQLWLHTCSKNPDIHWLLTTDQDTTPWSFPPNVTVWRQAFHAFRNHLAEKLDLALPHFSPYKLCDFRPTWGVVFEERNQGYDFWGSCDLDVLWGALAPHLLHIRMQRFDRVLTCGHLSLYRNEARVNRAFQLRHPEPDLQWRDVLTEPCNRPFTGFDEHQGINRIMRHHGFSIYEREADVADIHPYYPDHFLAEGHNHARQAFGWSGGHVYQYYENFGRVNTRELLYLHFQKRQIRMLPDSVPEDNAVLMLGPSGFMLLDRAPTPEDLTRANPRRTAYPWLITKARIRRRLPRFLHLTALRKRLGWHFQTQHGSSA